MAYNQSIKNIYEALRQSWLVSLLLFLLVLFVAYFAVYSFVGFPLNILFPSVIANISVLLFRRERVWFLLGLNFDWTGVRLFFEGYFLPLLAFIPILLFFLPYGVSLNPNLAFNDFAVRTTLLILFSASSEEFVFRGILFQMAIEKKGEIFPTLAFSVAFGLFHLLNPHINFLGIINIFFANVVLSAMFFRAYSLWLPIGFHFGWNFWQSFLLDSPISGTYLGLHLFRTRLPEFNPIIFGGSFGIEGGFVGFFALSLFFVIALKRYKPIPHIYSRILRERYCHPTESNGIGNNGVEKIT